MTTTDDHRRAEAAARWQWLDRLASDPNVTAQTVRTGLLLMSFYNHAVGAAWPSLATLARASGAAKRTIIRSLDQLRERGYITPLHAKGRSNQYLLNLRLVTPVSPVPTDWCQTSTRGGDKRAPGVVTNEHHEPSKGTFQRNLPTDETKFRSELKVFDDQVETEIEAPDGETGSAQQAGADGDHFAEIVNAVLDGEWRKSQSQHKVRMRVVELLGGWTQLRDWSCADFDGLVDSYARGELTDDDITHRKHNTTKTQHGGRADASG